MINTYFFNVQPHWPHTVFRKTEQIYSESFRLQCNPANQTVVEAHEKSLSSAGFSKDQHVPLIVALHWFEREEEESIFIIVKA